MNYLIFTIWLLIGLGIMSGSFYFGYKVGIIHKNSLDDKVRLEDAYRQMDVMSEHITQLEYRIEQSAMDTSSKQKDISRGWNPSDPLNTPPRERR